MKVILDSLRNTFAQMASSKKVVTALSTLVVAILAVLILPTAQKYGLPINEETIVWIVGGIFGTGTATIVGQGLKEHGKEGALIDAISDDPEAPTTQTLQARGLLGLSQDTLITLGVQAFLSQIKGPNKRGKIRDVAYKLFQQIRLAYPEFD